MPKIFKTIKESPIWLITILVSITAVIFLIYSPFQISLFPDLGAKKIYYVDNISDAHLEIIKKFNALYKGKIEVVPVNLPFYHFTTNDRKEILTRSLRSRNDGIDIFAVDLIWIPRFAKWGYLLDDHFDDSTLSHVNASALETCRRNDKLVAFPLFLDMGVLYYRKDLIRELPHGDSIESRIRNGMTWNEFINLGRSIKTSNHFPGKYDSGLFYVFPGGNYEGMLCCFQEMLSEHESDDIFYNDPINLNTSPARKALQMMVDLVYNYKFSPSEVVQFDEYNSYLYATNNNALFLRGWIGFRRQYSGFLEDTSAVSSWDIAPLPHFDGNKTSSVFGGWSLMISEFSNRKEEALEFIKFMFRKENQELLYEEGGYLPINMEVYSDSSFLQKHRELAQIEKLLSWGRYRPSLDNYTRLSEIMSSYFHKALKKEIPVGEALMSASKQINDERLR
ncbi:MAG TPA: extracellular solute-binding protein [Candidatus Acidoferrales bacterium]|nr:extracellular solute-binding protein [Candidatus Acidoferrales bacterium]